MEKWGDMVEEEEEERGHYSQEVTNTASPSWGDMVEEEEEEERRHARPAPSNARRAPQPKAYTPPPRKEDNRDPRQIRSAEPVHRRRNDQDAHHGDRGRGGSGVSGVRDLRELINQTRDRRDQDQRGSGRGGRDTDRTDRDHPRTPNYSMHDDRGAQRDYSDRRSPHDKTSPYNARDARDRDGGHRIDRSTPPNRDRLSTSPPSLVIAVDRSGNRRVEEREEPPARVRGRGTHTRREGMYSDNHEEDEDDYGPTDRYPRDGQGQSRNRHTPDDRHDYRGERPGRGDVDDLVHGTQRLQISVSATSPGRQVDVKPSPSRSTPGSNRSTPDRHDTRTPNRQTPTHDNYSVNRHRYEEQTSYTTEDYTPTKSRQPSRETTPSKADTPYKTPEKTSTPKTTKSDTPISNTSTPSKASEATPSKAESQPSSTEGGDPNEAEWSHAPVVGTCQDLEKPYTRLTSRPSPSVVRPENVLRMWLPLLLRKYTRGQKKYDYVGDQLRSIRQDLVVQHIVNEFTVEVYEANARMAVENGDFSEFNVCQCQLRDLYTKGIAVANLFEFMAYAVLYGVLNLDFASITKMLTIMTADHRAQPSVAHALQVVDAVQAKNYAGFRKLYETAPNLGKLFMDDMMNRFVRAAAFSIMLKAYRPNIPVEFLQQELMFKSKDACLAFLEAQGVPVSTTPAGVEVILTK